MLKKIRVEDHGEIETKNKPYVWEGVAGVRIKFSKNSKRNSTE
jgi:hypothetical protein